jgi:hypothetical protein
MPETETNAPVTPPEPAAATPAPAVSAPATPPGDISALAQPGPSRADAIQTQMAPFQAKEQQATQKAADLANQSTAPPPPGPHARLLAMVQGLSLGLDSFGKSIATGGREGGAQEVQQVRGEQQKQQIQAQQAREAQKNTQIQQQLTVADTNHKLAQNVLLMATLPNELAKSDLEVQGKKQALQSGVVALQDARHESIAKWGVDPLAPPGPAGTAQNVAGATKTTQQLINFASDPRVLGPDNPAVKDATTALADAQKTGNPDAIIGAQAGLRRAITFNQQAVESGTKQQALAETAPLGAKADSINAMTERIYQVLSPNQPLPPEFKLSADSTPTDQKRVDGLIEKLNTAQGTKANRDIVNGMREQMLNLAKGTEIPGDETKTGPEYLATLPAGLQGTVKSIGEGRAAPPAAGSRSPAAQSILGALNRAYPGYDATRFPVYQKTRADFTSGGQVAKSINGGHTVLQHLAALQQLNTDASRIPGTKAHQAFQNQLDTLAPELARFYGNETVEGIAGYKNTLGSFLNRDVAIKQQARSMKEKYDAYQTQWDSGSPPGAVAPITIFGPKEQDTYNKITGGRGDAAAGGFTVTAPDGSVHTFKDQQGVDSFKKLAGIQ